MVDREDRLTAPALTEESKKRHLEANTFKARKKPGPKKGVRRLAADPMRDDVLDDTPPDERDAADEMENLSDEERAAIFFASSSQSALPDLPEIPGYHTCWLTTASKSDTVAKRLRLGYQLIRAKDLGPQWQSMGVASGGEFTGCVMVNEMIAAKLPNRIFQFLMAQAHHEAPLSEEEKIRTTIDTHADELEGHGSRLIEGDAMLDLAKRRPAPNFVR